MWLNRALIPPYFIFSLAHAFWPSLNPLDPLQAHPPAARLWSFPRAQQPCFSRSAQLENPVMKDLPLYAFPFLPEPLQLYAALKAALMGYGLALTAHPDAKQTPGRLHNMPSIHLRVNDVHRSHSKWSIWSNRQNSSCMYILKILTEANSPA